MGSVLRRNPRTSDKIAEAHFQNERDERSDGGRTKSAKGDDDGTSPRYNDRAGTAGENHPIGRISDHASEQRGIIARSKQFDDKLRMDPCVISIRYSAYSIFILYGVRYIRIAYGFSDTGSLGFCQIAFASFQRKNI